MTFRDSLFVSWSIREKRAGGKFGRITTQQKTERLQSEKGGSRESKLGDEV